ncbi:MAG TPA: hypothetical protein VGA82_05795 [Dehalococcoidales bacterium]
MTKKAVAIVSVLAVALAGVLVWAILTMNQLTDTQDTLSSTQAQLLVAATQLEETRDELNNTKNELTSTKDELTSTKNELTSTKSELASTKSALVAAESTASVLRAQVLKTEQQLTVAQETLKGLGITLAVSSECSDAVLVDNATATNPTWSQLINFLSKDLTENHTYVANVYDCSQFSRDLHNHAEAAGIRVAEVQVGFKNNPVGHALNAFLTTDYGLVYVDCTQVPDKTARVKAGTTFRAVEVYFVSLTNIRNDTWWDTLGRYYYIPSSTGDLAVTLSIKIYW